MVKGFKKNGRFIPITENSTARDIMTGIPIIYEDHKIVDHLGLPKPDWEKRYGKLPNRKTMTHGQKMNYLNTKVRKN